MVYGDNQMDKIIVKGLKVFAYHGVNPEEKINGQNFILDITAYIDLTKQKLRSVTVCVKKPEAPIDADFEYTAVEITVGK